jgi:CheY-like chemotaxis protein
MNLRERLVIIVLKQTNACCILVVEDHLGVRDFIADHLRDAGYIVLEAASGEEAIAMLRAAHFPPISVVFTDIQLGGSVTGWDVAEAFRKARPDIPVIYTSGLLQSHTRQVPGSTFLPKPYLPSDIVELIERRVM